MIYGTLIWVIHFFFLAVPSARKHIYKNLQMRNCIIPLHLIFNLWTQFGKMQDNGPWKFQASHLPVIIMGHKISTISPLVPHLSLDLAVRSNSIKSLNVYHYARVLCTHIESHLSWIYYTWIIHHCKMGIIVGVHYSKEWMTNEFIFSIHISGVH